jgi:hypothetical protein
MAIIEKVGRLARLAFFLGLGGATALVQACGSSTRGPSDASDTAVEDGEEDASTDTVADPDTVQDTGTPDDENDLWDVVCE